MVIKSLRSRVLLLAALFPVLFLPLACNVDLLGLIASGELDVRLESKNVFKFLTGSDRNRSLGNEYSFIVLTDTHIEDGKAHGLEGLKDLIKPDDKFVVVTGDITQNGSRRDVEKFIEIARTLGIPCYPVIGNHDIYFDNWPIWKDLIGSTRYRIDHDTTSLFVLDSANASFGSDQLDWLQDELRSAQSHVFVFTHANLFVETPADIEQLTDTRERARIISILKGRADAMFMGHVHRRIIRKAGGVEYITIEDFKANGVYCRVHVSDSGISWEFEKL
ncbi:metallophosphoesterase [Treponema primitia]|uniref:metallophosphoesterase family protein n=1 Tax=Treponema primitia TaxID=88058 RepID=UPI00397F5988